MRDHLALHTGRLDTFEFMAVESRRHRTPKAWRIVSRAHGLLSAERKGKAKDATKARVKSPSVKCKGKGSKEGKGDQSNKNQETKYFFCGKELATYKVRLEKARDEEQRQVQTTQG